MKGVSHQGSSSCGSQVLLNTARRLFSCFVEIQIRITSFFFFFLDCDDYILEFLDDGSESFCEEDLGMEFRDF